MTRTDNCLLT